MVITALLRVDDLTVERLLAFLEAHWLNWARFRCRPVLHGAVWRWEVDPVFSLRRHVHAWSLPLNTEAELADWVSERLADPLPQNRPHWCFHVRRVASGPTALLLRIHHCYADGLSLLGVFDHLCTCTPEDEPRAPSVDTQALRQQWFDESRAWLLRHVRLGGTPAVVGEASAQAVSSAPESLEKLAHQGLRLINELTQYLLEPPDSPSALRKPLSGRKRCAWSAPRPLAAFAQAARQTGARINDVLLACVAEAMHLHLKACGEDPRELILHAAVPVDLRPMLDEKLRPPPGTLGNLFGTVFVPLPVDADSPLERLFRVKHETRRLKQSWQPGISWGLLCSAGLLPRDWQSSLVDLFSRKATAVVSNVPGTREPRYLAGCRVREQMFWVPQSGQIGVGVSILSYAGQVQFGVIADEAVLPDPTVFVEHCARTLDHWPEMRR